jgi:hypothetical protein
MKGHEKFNLCLSACEYERRLTYLSALLDRAVEIYQNPKLKGGDS